MKAPTVVVRVVVMDLGGVWLVEGSLDVDGPVSSEALDVAARWLLDEAEFRGEGAGEPGEERAGAPGPAPPVAGLRILRP
jgi:hypothetical protein